MSVGAVGAVESVGYEGRDVDELVADLAARGVDVLVDVRLNAVSRRRGFGKTALRSALGRAGIEYLHLPALGNPKHNRAAFHRADVESARRTFRVMLTSPDAAAALDVVSELTESRGVAVLCFERDEQRCHRRVVIEELIARGSRAFRAHG